MRTVSPTSDVELDGLPSSSFPPVPRETTSASCGFSLAVSGMMIPPGGLFFLIDTLHEDALTEWLDFSCHSFVVLLFLFCGWLVARRPERSPGSLSVAFPESGLRWEICFSLPRRRLQRRLLWPSPASGSAAVRWVGFSDLACWRHRHRLGRLAPSSWNNFCRSSVADLDRCRVVAFEPPYAAAMALLSLPSPRRGACRRISSSCFST